MFKFSTKLEFFTFLVECAKKSIKAGATPDLVVKQAELMAALSPYLWTDKESKELLLAVNYL